MLGFCILWKKGYWTICSLIASFFNSVLLQVFINLYFSEIFDGMVGNMVGNMWYIKIYYTVVVIKTAYICIGIGELSMELD